MSIKVGRKHHDMRIAGRIVGVRSTKQSVGIIVGGFCPQHLFENIAVKMIILKIRLCEKGIFYKKCKVVSRNAWINVTAFIAIM